MALKSYQPLDEWWEARKHYHANQQRTGAGSCLAYFEKYVGKLCTNCQMELTYRDRKFGPPELCEGCFDLEMNEE